MTSKHEGRTPPGAPRSGSRLPAFAAALAGAAILAWMPAAHTPEPTVAQRAPSYATMAATLTMLYPASRTHALGIVKAVHEEADRHGLDPCLVMGVIANESSFDPRAPAAGTRCSTRCATSARAPSCSLTTAGSTRSVRASVPR
jgi:hypothetical protein